MGASGLFKGRAGESGRLILAVMVAKTDGEPTAVQKASQDQAKAMVRVVRTGAKLATHQHNLAG